MDLTRSQNEIRLEMGDSYLSPGGDENIATTGGQALLTHPPEPTGPLTAHSTEDGTIVFRTAPIVEVDRLALPHFPVLLTTLTRRKDESPHSAAELSAAQ